MRAARRFASTARVPGREAQSTPPKPCQTGVERLPRVPYDAFISDTMIPAAQLVAMVAGRVSGEPG